jgi:3-hydroxyisobutyrate dehydrogenase-like beta-hydroxyacid dehydrogenase
MDVGFIGLGRMGTPMALNLLNAGHRVIVYNRTLGKAEALALKGAQVAGRVADACRGDVLITMLSDDAAVEDVVFGEGGALYALGRNAIHISMSTISVALADRLAEAHAKAGQDYVAAPVFGRPEAAAAAKLFIIAASAEAALARCQPLFDVLGQETFVVGHQTLDGECGEAQRQFPDRLGAGESRRSLRAGAKIRYRPAALSRHFDWHAVFSAGLSDLRDDHRRRERSGQWL